MKFYDITHPLGNTTAAWPGDQQYTLQPTWQISKGNSVNISRITLSPHNGTHADAPYHYEAGGLRMDEVPPERYIGPARVVALEGRQMITVADLEAIPLESVERLLVRTGSCPDYTRFHDMFTAFEPDAVAYLAGRGVRLIGTDAHSMDPKESTELPSHHACAAAGILILENLNLAAVPPGDYELIALPLKLVGADGSPVRAVLRAV